MNSKANTAKTSIYSLVNLKGFKEDEKTILSNEGWFLEEWIRKKGCIASQAPPLRLTWQCRAFGEAGP
jgi:hypothetical protein